MTTEKKHPENFDDRLTDRFTVELTEKRSNFRGSKPLTDDMVKALLAKAPTPRDRLLYALAAFAGPRFGSMAPLRLSDVCTQDGAKDEIVFSGRESKTGYTYSVAVHVRLAKAIEDRAAEILKSGGHYTTYLFRRAHGKQNLPIQYAAAYQCLKRDLRAAGIVYGGRYGFHSLRKTFAYKIWEQTGDIMMVALALGHQTIWATLQYLRDMDGRCAKAVRSIDY